jgi:hypothetical protein
VLRKVGLVLLALVLLALPSVGRWLYYYEGSYQPQPVPRPDLTSVEAPLPQAGTFADEYRDQASGTILVDLAHENRVQMAELRVLQARLTARNQRLQALNADDDLSRQLRHARALIVISPGADWTSDEIEQVANFVAKGGRLLLVTDPSRFEVLYDEWDYYVGLDHDVVHVNDLAARFGLVFEADYLYNTSDNEGNYRNIKLRQFADDALVEALDRLVFYASHSIVTEEAPLIVANDETRSSASEWGGPRTVAVLTTGRSVLGLGDLTFITEPYNAVYDNDRFLANIADWLTAAPRRYALEDFPFFFQDAVDLVYAGDPLLDGELLEGGSALQDFFADQNISLDVREQEDSGRDTVFLGLYEQAGEIEPYLAAAEVTLWITSTAEIRRPGEEDQEAPRPKATPSSSLTQPLTTTATTTPAVGLEMPALPKERVEIGSLGQMVITGTSLLLFQNDDQRQVLVVLADREAGLDSALKRLMEASLEGCLFHETETSTLALCPYGDASSDGGWQKPQPGPAEQTPPTPPLPTEELPEPTSEPQGSILILSLDVGPGEYDDLTSAAEYRAILEARHDVTVWSTSEDGIPDLTQILDYDLVVWTAGDHRDAFEDETSNLLFNLMLEGIPMIVSGAFVSDSTSQAVQRDIQVYDSAHPLASGFAPDAIIPFATSPSGSEYEIDVLEDVRPGEDTIVFVRGPQSEASGIASLVVVEEEVSGLRLLLVGFPLYLLPEEPRVRLVENSVSWLLSPSVRP